MTSIAHTLFFFVIALIVLIAVHEFGHYWAAHKLGVKVLRFSLGFGKIVWRRQKSPQDTEFTLSALPLGGYVKMVQKICPMPSTASRFYHDPPLLLPDHYPIFCWPFWCTGLPSCGAIPVCVPCWAR